MILREIVIVRALLRPRGSGVHCPVLSDYANEGRKWDAEVGCSPGVCGIVRSDRFPGKEFNVEYSLETESGFPVPGLAVDSSYSSFFKVRT